MEEKIKLRLPLICEGRYDKATLSGYVIGNIITTGGFSIFNNKEKQALIRKIAMDGIIVLCDSDGGGKQIRAFLSGLLPPDKIHHVYIPKIEGKEKRKRVAGKAGLLGVEGMSREVLWRILSPFAVSECDAGDSPEKKIITKTDLYLDGLSGGMDSSEKRRRLCALADLPDDMTAKALLEALNLLYGYDDYKRMVAELQ